LGGQQFDGITDGLGFDSFLGFPVTDRTDLEIGVSITRHQRSLLCVFGRPCIPREEFVVLGLYAQPTFRIPVSTPALAAYAGPHLGLLVGDFQDGAAGLDVGLASGVGFSASERGSLSVVYMGDPPPAASRGHFGRRAALRFGLIICFDKQGMSLGCRAGSV
jgi:hypothetical protein